MSTYVGPKREPVQKPAPEAGKKTEKQAEKPKDEKK